MRKRAPRGTQYVDEIVALKLEHGYCVVSQDANYNVTTLTDLAGRAAHSSSNLALANPTA
ncbi:MAG: hypothetical protein IT449_07560 [Phycisphaerales bacterium]|nr:hypothetical protein [Phycisphaerales bacterium]